MNCQYCGRPMVLVGGIGMKNNWMCNFVGCISKAICPKCRSKAKITETSDGKAICSNEECNHTWVY